MTDEELEQIDGDAEEILFRLGSVRNEDRATIRSLVAELRKTREELKTKNLWWEDQLKYSFDENAKLGEENERFKKALEAISDDIKFGDLGNLNDPISPAMHIASHFRIKAREALEKK